MQSDKRRVDLLLSHQSMYRQKIGWDRNTESILSAVGFLCGVEKELCHYLIDKIVNEKDGDTFKDSKYKYCLLYTSPSPRDRTRYRMPSSA